MPSIIRPIDYRIDGLLHNLPVNRNPQDTGYEEIGNDSSKRRMGRPVLDEGNYSPVDDIERYREEISRKCKY
jgi:hypothetical protein